MVFEVSTTEDKAKPVTKYCQIVSLLAFDTEIPSPRPVVQKSLYVEVAMALYHKCQLLELRYAYKFFSLLACSLDRKQPALLL
ncbi:hypothetical protein O6P43_028547 [Quillaja saponaria]|uniref:Uncharacterized protein n=1 Tax=Quillaja saponaria TaxID=32244 RepID=A0AAD7PAS8_QUISA|nr:hypothetical protein O6P43_028547 [Quillaja saponaria]